MLSGWGRQFVEGHELKPETLDGVPAVLFRGMGRSYGDASLPSSSQSTVVTTTRANRIISFDATTGVLRAEAGLRLEDLNRTFLPRGWFTPVTPGTSQVTLGGMVAADVHGKNHHLDGCFGAHVRRLKMRLADGSQIECGPQLERELFLATVAGMGLTGQILEVEFGLRRIPTPWIVQHSERVTDIDAYVEALERAVHTSPFAVGWVDCLSRGSALGRGIVTSGRWAQAHESPAQFPTESARLRWPFEAPNLLLTAPAIRAMNTAIYRAHGKSAHDELVDPQRFFYALDRLHDWNLLYGRRGMTQYQCLLPTEAGQGAARRLLEVLARRKTSAFLCVIKACGAESQATLSFPRPGLSVAFDLPVGRDTQSVIDALNDQVLAEGGRIYLAKDQFTRPEHFRAMEPRLFAFEQLRARWDPEKKFKSAMSVRLFGD